MNLNRFILPFFLPFYCNGKEWKRVRTSGNSGNFQDGRTFLSKLPAFKTLVVFVILTFSNFPTLGPSFFSIVQTSRSRGQDLSGSARGVVVYSIPEKNSPKIPKIHPNIPKINGSIVYCIPEIQRK